MKPSSWPPALLLLLCAVLATVGVKAQRTMSLVAPLESAVDSAFGPYRSRDVVLSEQEVRVAGVTNYLARVFEADSASRGSQPAFYALYVGYYDRQSQGRTIHSPKNCLPGAGWEPLSSRTDTIAGAYGPAPVNRYLLQRKTATRQEQALVLYWYQGRGRIASNEYRVKWDLLKDSAIRRRSDEALVRIVVPITGSEQEAEQLARRAAAEVARSLVRALPA